MATVRSIFAVIALSLTLLSTVTETFSPSATFVTKGFAEKGVFILTAAADDADKSTTQAPPPVVLNGKRVLPYKILSSGLKGQKQVPAVYAVLNSSYKRGSEGWEATEYVGVSQDLDATLKTHLEKHGTDKVSQIRALSFSFPEPGAMREVASQWKEMATKGGAEMIDSEWAYVDALEYLYDEDDDDEDDEYEWDEEDMAMTAQAMASVPSSADLTEKTVISPFEKDEAAADVHVEESGTLEFTSANVDKVLNEVRPYLISDGGNVAVERVDEAEKTVYLKLEGACGSCASSTVTMQMGIERVLKENFPDLKEVLQVEDDPESKPTELTWQAVEDEVNRLKPAIIAMGGVVELISVDPIGTVELKYRGANKVKQGLELAIRDVPFVNQVSFVMGDDE